MHMNNIRNLLSKNDTVVATALYQRICARLEDTYLDVTYPMSDNKPDLRVSMNICDSRLVNDNIMKQIKVLLSADGWKNINLQTFERGSFTVTMSILNIDIKA